MNALVTLQTSLECDRRAAVSRTTPQRRQTLSQRDAGESRRRGRWRRRSASTPRATSKATSQKLLEDPIMYAEGLLRTLGPAELNGKGKALCAPVPRGHVEVSVQSRRDRRGDARGGQWDFPQTGWRALDLLRSEPAEVAHEAGRALRSGSRRRSYVESRIRQLLQRSAPPSPTPSTRAGRRIRI